MPPAHFDPNDVAQLRALRELAEQAARVGGAVAKEHFGGEHAVRRKPDGSEVSDADEAAQAAVVACLRASRPDDAIIAEETLGGSHGAAEPRSHEGGEGRGDEEEPRASARAAARAPDALPSVPAPSDDALCWVVDPLDGTRNYIRDVPLYAVSVAAMYGGYPAAGAIFAPDRGDMYSVSRAESFLINGQPAPATRPAASASRGRSPKPLVGIPSSLEGGAYAVMQGWISRVALRNLGSTALHLAMVAAGQFQAALISDSRLWDVAAGWLMVTAMGGVMTRLDGAPVFPLNVAGYANEPIPSLASCDAQMHACLLKLGAAPP